MPHFYDSRAGPIKGLYLPTAAWKMLRREHIATIDQLRANADRLAQLDGIEARTMQAIRQALASDERPLDKKRYELVERVIPISAFINAGSIGQKAIAG